MRPVNDEKKGTQSIYCERSTCTFNINYTGCVLNNIKVEKVSMPILGGEKIVCSTYVIK